MKILNRTLFLSAITGLALCGVSCESWDTASNKKKGTITGAAVGAGAGAIIDDKSARGAIVGGAAGGFLGRQIGKEKDKNEQLEERVRDLEN